MALIEDRAVYLNALGLDKTLEQAIIDGDLSGGGGGGGGGSAKVEVFNVIVSVANNSPVVGISFYVSALNKGINNVSLMVWDKLGVTTGSLSIDIKKNTSPDSVGMTSIFTSVPTIDFSVDPNYTKKSGTLLSGSFTSSDVLRLDVLSVPAGWSGRFSLTVFAQ
jgi:hypothetical protein